MNADIYRWCPQGDPRWLQERHAATPYTAAEARAGSNSSLRWACANGHLVIAQWLVATFGLGVADVRVGDNEALREAYSKGHRELTRWLVALGEYTREEVVALLGKKAVAKLSAELRAEPEEETLMIVNLP